MTWVVGIVGFISGFALGQVILLYLLKDKTDEELLKDKGLKWKFGLLNWGLAGFVCWCALKAYETYF